VTAWPILNDQLFLALDYVEVPSGRFAGGACDDSPEGAMVRAHSEATERASLIENGPLMVISRDEALERGLCLVTPHDILSDTEDWVPARRATTGEGAGVPADVALLRRVSSRLRVLPWRQSSVGTAAHPDRDAAGVSGILECLERYAIRRVWVGTATLEPATDRLRDLMPAGLATAFENRKLVAYAWSVREMAPVHVTLVLVGRKDRAQATFGAGVGFEEDRALTHALREAVMVRASLGNRANRNEREFQRGARAARHQEAFLTYLRELETPADESEATNRRSITPADLPVHVEERFGVAPLLIDVPSLNANAVVKAVIPSAEFLTPRSGGDYIFAPGYLD
jgi:ribosomal protein S12 methylthiotransferase accessory factor YcaO